MKVSHEGVPSGVVATAPVQKGSAGRGGVKKMLVGMIILGALTTVLQPGTFANFSAETDNAATIQTGTLVLENKLGTTAGQQTATDCYSTNGALGTTVNTANSSACGTFFSGPGGGTTVGTGSTVTGVQFLTLKDIGTLNAATSSLTIACTTATSGGTFTGTGDLCNGLKIIVAETLADFSTLKTANTALVGACTGATIATCPLSGGASGPVSAGSISANPGAWTAGTSRFFYVSVGLAGTTDNALQGRQAAMTFKWVTTE